MNKRNKGITLVALVITIIVLLIMAGVSIALVVGDNGVITQSKNAKDNTIIEQEKEQISLAYSSAVAKKLGDTVTSSDLQTELDLSVGSNLTSVTSNGIGLDVWFKETNHNYNVNGGKITRLADGEGVITTLSDAEKLKQFYLANNYIASDVIGTLYEVDGKKVWYICEGTEEDNWPVYVLYNESIFKVEFDLDNGERVTDVQFVKNSNIDLTTFGEYTVTIGSIEKTVLVTPSTPEYLVHGNFSVFDDWGESERNWYVSVHPELENFEGYVADGEGNFVYFYDGETGELAYVFHIKMV